MKFTRRHDLDPHTRVEKATNTYKGWPKWF